MQKASNLRSIGNSMTTDQPPTSHARSPNSLIFNAHARSPSLARAKLIAKKALCPVSAGLKTKKTMKKSILIKTVVAALAIGAAFPLGAFAAPAAKSTADKGTIQTVHAPRKHYFAKGWLES